jgi:cyclase
MERVRIIAKLDVKPPYVIKGVHLEGLRKVGKPEEMAVKYYEQGADEIFYVDCVASLYRREILYDLVRETAGRLFVPFCVGGGVKTVDDAAKLLHAGADKVLMNTYAIANPSVIKDSARVFGSQCVVVSIEAKKWGDKWECYTDCGRIRSGKDVIDWAREAQDLGAGEILLTSVDCDGRKRGFDIELTKKVSEAVNIPVVASGGAGTAEHIAKVIDEGYADAVAVASILHYGEATINDIKGHCRARGLEVLS